MSFIFPLLIFSLSSFTISGSEILSFSKGSFVYYPPPHANWSKVKLSTVEIYYTEEVSDWIPRIYDMVSESVDDLSRLFGKKPKIFKLFLFFSEDIIGVDIDVYRKIAFLNLGGIRYDIPPFYTVEDFVRFAVACSYFESFPRTFPPQLQFFPTDFITPHEVISSLCEYASLKSKEWRLEGGLEMSGIIFSPFISEGAKIFWFMEKKREKKVLRYFSFELPRFEGTREFLSFADAEFIKVKNAMQMAYGKLSEIKFLDHKSRPRAKSGIGIKMGFIPHVRHMKDVYVYEKMGDDELIKIFLEFKRDMRKIIRSEVRTGERGWYPDIFFDDKRKIGRVIFVQKHISRDKLCYADFKIINGDSIEFRESVCPVVSEKFEEFFSPDLSHDGTRVVFAVKRRNGFVDIAYAELPQEKKERETSMRIKYIFQDRFIDIYPKWGGEKKIYFSSNRDGFFSVYSYSFEMENEIQRGRLEKLIEYPAHTFITDFVEKEGSQKKKKKKLILLVYRKGQVIRGEYDTKDKGGRHIHFTRESFVIEKESMNVESSSSISFPGRLRFSIPSYSITESGFAVFDFEFNFSDDLFRHVLSFGLGYRLPFNTYAFRTSQEKNIIFLEGGNLGISSSLLLRYFRPFISISFNSDDFSGIFIRYKGEDRDFYEFFPERRRIIRSFLIYPIRYFLWFRDSFFFLGGRWGNVSSDILERVRTDSFWRGIGNEYTRNYGYGNFFGIDTGFFMRGAKFRKGILMNGADIKTLLGLRRFTETTKSLFMFDFSADFRSQEIMNFLVLSIRLSSFMRIGDLKRFYVMVGSKNPPFYYDPPPYISPHLRFGLLLFDPDSIFWDTGLIRGIPVFRESSGATVSVQPNARVLTFHTGKILDSMYFFVSPFMSFGVAPLPFSGEAENLFSFGVEGKANFIFLNEIPLSLLVGVARGITTEVYFSLTLTPGAFR